MKFKNIELKYLTDKNSTFSAGDLSAIKMLYASKKHFGEWHK
jgi:hypothetical protein